MVWKVRNVILRGRCKESDTCENRGRRSILWTLPKRWQACVIRRIAFHVTGAGNPHHGCYVLGRRARFLRRVAFLELELEV